MIDLVKCIDSETKEYYILVFINDFVNEVRLEYLAPERNEKNIYVNLIKKINKSVMNAKFLIDNTGKNHLFACSIKNNLVYFPKDKSKCWIKNVCDELSIEVEEIEYFGVEDTGTIGIQEKANSRKIEETDLALLIYETLENPDEFYKKIGEKLTPDERKYIKSFLRKECKTCTNSMCDVEKQKNIKNDCLTWENNELVGEYKVLKLNRKIN